MYFKCILVHFTLICTFILKGTSLKAGAPCSAVEKMKPIHSGVTESSDLDLFNKFKLRYTNENNIEISHNCYHENMTIKVRFISEENNLEFKGFAIQARQTESLKRRVGSFEVQNSEFARRHCDEPGAVTHKDADTTLNTRHFFVTWKPSKEYKGAIYFNITIALEKQTWKSLTGHGNTLSYDASCRPRTTSSTTSTKTSTTATTPTSTTAKSTTATSTTATSTTAKSTTATSTTATSTTAKSNTRTSTTTTSTKITSNKTTSTTTTGYRSPIRCSNKIYETTYTGPWTCGNMDNTTNEYFHVEKGSKAKIDGLHYVCDGCIFNITKNSTYTAINSEINLQNAGKLNIKLENFLLSNSKLTLDNATIQTLIDYAPGGPYSDISNVSIMNSEINLSGVIFYPSWLHFLEIKYSIISIQNEQTDNDDRKYFYFGEAKGCIKWKNSKVNLNSGVEVYAFGPWVMEPNSKIEANGPFRLEFLGTSKPLIELCDTNMRGLHLLSYSSIKIRPYNPDYRFLIVIGGLSLLMIGENKTLEFQGHFRLYIHDLSQFYMLENLILTANNQNSEPDLKIGAKLNCSFESNNHDNDHFFEITQPTTVTEDNTDLPTISGLERLNCSPNT